MFGINYATIIDPVLRDMRKYLPDFAGMKPGDSVLDVCCGSGAQVYEYTRKGMIATGLDGNQGMLALAEKYYYDDGVSSATFKLADAAHLPFADGRFDFTSISLALHEKDAALVDMILSEMKRVTRKDGFLVFADFNTPLPRTIVGYSIRIIEFFAGKQHYRCFRDYLIAGGLHAILERGGLMPLKQKNVKGGGIALAMARNT
jgi:ubiquinone/menaquinone biosynthesis C-methylase UbiE